MEPREIDLYLTDFAFHANHKRGAKTLEKAAMNKTPDGQPYGRLYGRINPDGKFEVEFPQDVIDQINRGELKIRIFAPKDGLYGFADKTIPEKLAQTQRKKRNMGQHSARLHHKRHK